MHLPFKPFQRARKTRTSEQWLDQSPSPSKSAERILSFKDGRIFVDGEEVLDDLRQLLHDEARYIENSQLWELLNASIAREANDLALRQSTTWEHVLSAKMLRHYQHYFANVLLALSKK